MAMKYWNSFSNRCTRRRVRDNRHTVRERVVYSRMGPPSETATVHETVKQGQSTTFTLVIIEDREARVILEALNHVFELLLGQLLVPVAPLLQDLDLELRLVHVPTHVHTIYHIPQSLHGITRYGENVTTCTAS